MARRTIWISVSVVVLFALGVVVWLVTQDDLTDADVVYCLSDAQRAGLADAAVTLGLAHEAMRAEDVIVDGEPKPIPVSRWRERRPEDFEKACSAIRPARPSALTPLQTGLFATFNVIAGGLLGFGSANLVQRSARAQQNGRSLRAATTAFLAAARGYARDWSSPVQPSDLAVQGRRAELISELRMVGSEYPDSPADASVTRLSERLSEEVFRRWQAQDHQEVANELQALETEVFELANLIEHPWRNRATLHGKTGSGG